MRTIVSLAVFVTVFGFSLAHGFDAWGPDSHEPVFQAFGGSDSDMNPWFNSNPSPDGNTIWNSGSSLFQGFSLEGLDGQRPSLEPNIFDDWNSPSAVGTSFSTSYDTVQPRSSSGGS